MVKTICYLFFCIRESILSFQCFSVTFYSILVIIDRISLIISEISKSFTADFTRTNLGPELSSQSKSSSALSVLTSDMTIARIIV